MKGQGRDPDMLGVSPVSWKRLDIATWWQWSAYR